MASMRMRKVHPDMSAKSSEEKTSKLDTLLQGLLKGEQKYDSATTAFLKKLANINARLNQNSPLTMAQIAELNHWMKSAKAALNILKGIDPNVAKELLSELKKRDLNRRKAPSHGVEHLPVFHVHSNFKRQNRISTEEDELPVFYVILPGCGDLFVSHHFDQAGANTVTRMLKEKKAAKARGEKESPEEKLIKESKEEVLIETQSTPILNSLFGNETSFVLGDSLLLDGEQVQLYASEEEAFKQEKINFPAHALTLIGLHVLPSAVESGRIRISIGLSAIELVKTWGKKDRFQEGFVIFQKHPPQQKKGPPRP